LTDKDEGTRPGFTAGLPDRDNIPRPEFDETDPNRILLRTWQTERLQRTYADFLETRRYGPAARFFISDIYGAKEFKQRNYDIEYFYNLMRRFIPDILLSLVRNAIEVYHMTEELDRKLTTVLVEELGMEDHITEEMYAEAYRLCDNYDERKHQIELLLEIGRQVDFSTRIPPIGIALRLARGPANRTGWHELHDFLNRGYKSFKQMGSAQKFLDAIRQREFQILDRIYANHPDPFALAQDE
jgi:hypothetical protein